MQIVRFIYHNSAVPHYLEGLPGIDRFGADRTILLAYNTWFSHRPGQAPGTINKRCSDLYRSGLGKFIKAQFFRQTDGTDSGRRADEPAGRAVQLTAAGPDAVIMNRGPKIFKPTGKTARLNDIGRANSHALAAFNTAQQKLFFRK